MDDQDFEAKLFRPVDKYGDKYVEHLLEQYKLYLNSAEKISDRRQAANTFFLGLNTAFLSLLAWIKTKPETGSSLVFIAASFSGAIVCYFWYRMMRSYRDLNGAKFMVIHAIEKRLPLSMYDVEWDIVERGQNRGKYWPFSHIEMKVPAIFIVIYCIVLASESARLLIYLVTLVSHWLLHR
jgi:hypothetical protein